MSNIQTGAERMPHDLSHLGFLAGQIGRLITISTTPVIAGDSFEMDAVGALRLSPLRRGLAIDSTVDIFTFYVPHRHVYGELDVGGSRDHHDGVEVQEHERVVLEGRQELARTVQDVARAFVSGVLLGPLAEKDADVAIAAADERYLHADAHARDAKHFGH